MTVSRESIKQAVDRLDDSQILQVAQLIADLQSQPHILPASLPKRLSDFYATLPATQPYPGTAILRHQVAASLVQPTPAPQPKPPLPTTSHFTTVPGQKLTVIDW